MKVQVTFPACTSGNSRIVGPYRRVNLKLPADVSDAIRIELEGKWLPRMWARIERGEARLEDACEIALAIAATVLVDAETAGEIAGPNYLHASLYAPDSWHDTQVQLCVNDELIWVS